MKLGVVFPQTEIGSDLDTIRDYTTQIEAAGYEFLVAYDHVAGYRPPDASRWAEIGPYTDAHAFHEVFVLFSYLAAITSQIEFATEVLVLPQRQTVLVAKQAAELQLMSGGRFRLGIGVGWNPEEYRALGANFHDRGRRVVEQIEVLRRLWAEDVVTFHGLYHDMNSIGLRPRPRSRPIPIWIGGSASVAIRRAASIADGFALDQRLEDAPTVLSELKRHLIEGNRDPRDFGLAARVQLKSGDQDSALRAAASWKTLGISHLSVNTMNAGLTDPRRHVDLALAFVRAWSGRG